MEQVKFKHGARSQQIMCCPKAMAIAFTWPLSNTTRPRAVTKTSSQRLKMRKTTSTKTTATTGDKWWPVIMCQVCNVPDGTTSVSFDYSNSKRIRGQDCRLKKHHMWHPYHDHKKKTSIFEDWWPRDHCAIFRQILQHHPRRSIRRCCRPFGSVEPRNQGTTAWYVYNNLSRGHPKWWWKVREVSSPPKWP